MIGPRGSRLLPLLSLALSCQVAPGQSRSSSAGPEPAQTSQAQPAGLAPAPASPAPSPAASPASPPPTSPDSPPPAAAVSRSASASGTDPLHFLAIGGGPHPESNEVSLEQDIELVQRALPPPGLVLFAGGSESASVRELANVGGDALRLALGDLFAPRSGRLSRYRQPRFAAQRATLDNVEVRLGEALARGDGPLLVYIASHGERGDEPKHNSIALWGGSALDVARLAQLHEQHRRPLRLVATSCFSGGFGELAFAGADAKLGKPSRLARCGLFAGTADRETSGCDPNPDRRAQESYGLHLAYALAGRRRDGSTLSSDAADFDGDGRIGLLDAHTWARIEAVSMDVPTSTSERWLRHAEPGSAAIDRHLLPEDAAVAERLGAALHLPNEPAVRQSWAALDRQLAELDDAIDAAEVTLADRTADLGTLVLERWPVLDDPFHPDFESTFEQARAALEALLKTSPAARARAEADAALRPLYARLDGLAIQEARVLRLLRAYETLHKAAALHARGGPAARYYEQLLACERAAP
jgi:hypothetical protein